MTDPMSLSRRRLRAWIRLLRLTRRSESHLREFLRRTYQTTLPRFDVMAALYRNGGPMKMSELSHVLLVSNGNATAVVDRLERDGLVMRKPVKTDRRVVEVALTEEGCTQFADQATAHEAEVNKLLAGLSHSDLDLLRGLLGQARGSEG